MLNISTPRRLSKQRIGNRFRKLWRDLKNSKMKFKYFEKASEIFLKKFLGAFKWLNVGSGKVKGA